MPSARAISFKASAACFLVAIFATGTATAGPWEVGGLGIDKTRLFKVETTVQVSGDRESWGLPVFKFAHPITDKVSYEIGYGYGRIDDASGRRSGSRDLELKLKHQIADQSETSLIWLFEPKLNIPVGDEESGVGSGRYALELPLRVGNKVGRLTYTSELRYTPVFGVPWGQHLVGAGGLIEFEPTDQWVLGIDLFADTPTGSPGGVHARTNVAGKWKPNRGFELQALVGRTLANARGDTRTVYKLQLEFKFH